MMNPLFGSKLVIQETEYATTKVQARKYPRSKAKSKSHWLRMNKKWLKRYGCKSVPCYYQSSFAIPRHITIFVHPTLAPKLRAMLDQLPEAQAI